MNLLRDNKGLSLIEVVVASTILILALIPMYSLIQWSMSGIQTAGEKTQLVAVAKGVMEETLAQRNNLEENYSYTGSVMDTDLPPITYEINVSTYQTNNNLQKISITAYLQEKADETIQIITIRNLRR